MMIIRSIEVNEANVLRIFTDYLPFFHFFVYLFIEACHPYEPFKCPSDGNCISIQYLCDGAPDCSDGYDEDTKLCTAGKNIMPLLSL